MSEGSTYIEVDTLYGTLLILHEIKKKHRESSLSSSSLERRRS